MRAIDEHTITEAALEQMASTPNPRLKEIMAVLTRHLHEFAREVDLTPEEWLEGIKFLTAVGQKCTAYRQEFILLSDTLGLSSLVNALHDRRATEAGTKSSLVGPFYRQDSPHMKLGDTIVTKPTNGLEVCLYGRVIQRRRPRRPQRHGASLAAGRNRQLRSAKARSFRNGSARHLPNRCRRPLSISAPSRRSAI